MNWDQITYLQNGGPRQQAAYAALTQAQVMERLARYDAVLAGTIPLGIDLPESDLDVICAVADHPRFVADLQAAFGHLPGFAVQQKRVSGLPTTIARFWAGQFLVEVFGQDRPVREQNGYRHMLVEARLLRLAGPAAAEAIRRLKAGGLKTEPAFAQYFGLAGDPYEELLTLSDLSDEALVQRITCRANILGDQ